MGSDRTHTETMAKARFFISSLGELYHDALKLEAWIKDRSMAAEGNSLLCAALMRREEYRNRALEYLAAKRGISREELIALILTDQAEKLSSEEYASAIQEQEEREE